MECDCNNFFFQEDLKIYICEECNKEKEYVKTASKKFDSVQVAKHKKLNSLNVQILLEWPILV